MPRPRPRQRRRHRPRLPTLHRLLLLPALPRPIHTAVPAWQWDAKEENGRVSKPGISRYRRPDPESHPAFAKATGNYLLSKTATLWAAQNGYDDAVLLDHEGFVSEASAQNLFMVSGGGLITPPESRS
jgi:branched-chain amino acid aminotransferase